MRLLLECHALKKSFQRGDLDWESRVVAAYHKLSVMEKRMIAGDHSELEIWKQFDWQFHHALISACGSKVLLDTHAAIYDKYLRYQMIAVVFRGEIAANQHRKLLECALGRDFTTAQQVLIGCVEHVLARGTDWATTSASKRASDLTNSSRARDKQVSRRGDRPARPRSTSA